MRYVFIIIIFIAAFYFAVYEGQAEKKMLVEQSTNEIIQSLDGIENEGNIDKSIEKVEKFNKNAMSEFEEMKKSAKSPESIQFVNLVEKQNEISARGLELSKKMQPLINNLDEEAFAFPDDLSETLTPLCNYEKEYIVLFNEMIEILDAKYTLVNEHPVVSSEMFNGEHDKARELMLHMLNSQGRVLEKEMQAYTDLNCDAYLAP